MTDERIGLTPYQMRAVDKLRKLRVGAVYSESRWQCAHRVGACAAAHRVG